jgi:hypothetical protein
MLKNENSLVGPSSMLVTFLSDRDVVCGGSGRILWSDNFVTGKKNLYHVSSRVSPTVEESQSVSQSVRRSRRLARVLLYRSISGCCIYRYYYYVR